MMPSERSDQRLMHIAQARQSMLLDGGAGAATVPMLSPWVERSWRRCLDMGLHPQQRVQFDPVSATQIARLQEHNHGLLEAAAPVIRSLARAMLHTRYFAILTDAHGTVIDVNGPVDRQNPHAASIARVGVDLSEAAAGTTAIGTSLTELQPVWLHRGEHFFQETTVYSCAGAPIIGPEGDCLGMLDLTGVDVPEQPALKHLVAQAARSIENALTLAVPHRLMLRLNWPGRVLGDDSDGLVCLDEDGTIVGMNRAASDMLCVPVREVHCSQVFAVDQRVFFDAAHHHKSALEVPLWTGLRLQVLAQSQVQPHSHRATRTPASHGVPLKDVEAALIRKAVDDARGNVMEAARALGISRATIYRKLGTVRKSGA